MCRYVITYLPKVYVLRVLSIYQSWSFLQQLIGYCWNHAQNFEKCFLFFLDNVFWKISFSLFCRIIIPSWYRFVFEGKVMVWSYWLTSSVIRQKDESQNGCFKRTKHAKFSEKRTFLTLWYASSISEHISHCNGIVVNRICALFITCLPKLFFDDAFALIKTLYPSALCVPFSLVWTYAW